MSKFTPGPWVIQEADFQVIQLAAANRIIAEAVRGFDTDEQDAANAYLIAAAPAMYAVLTRLVFAADAKLLSEKHKVIQEARDAIAIAEGRE